MAVMYPLFGNSSKAESKFCESAQKNFLFTEKPLILCFCSDKKDSTIYKNKETQCHKSLILARVQQ